MKDIYIYGPVRSRRLGYSLGIDIVFHKVCSFDCIYCQLGRTTNKTIERKVYIPPEEVLQQIEGVIKSSGRIDHLTFSGSGEPTLNSKIGYIISEIKKFTKIPVAVITNGSLLFMPDVQDDLIDADVVLPTLCSVIEETFQKINRPHPSLTIEKIIHGQIEFRKKYKGKIWLEIMLVKGINDSQIELRTLKEVIKRIEPDRIHLNTVVRPPSEKFASPLLHEELDKIRKFFGKNCEVIVEFKEERGRGYSTNKEAVILNLIKRRPATLTDIANALGLPQDEVIKYLGNLEKTKNIKSIVHSGQKYYQAVTNKGSK